MRKSKFILLFSFFACSPAKLSDSATDESDSDVLLLGIGKKIPPNFYSPEAVSENKKRKPKEFNGCGIPPNGTTEVWAVNGINNPWCVDKKDMYIMRFSSSIPAKILGKFCTFKGNENEKYIYASVIPTVKGVNKNNEALGAQLRCLFVERDLKSVQIDGKIESNNTNYK